MRGIATYQRCRANKVITGVDTHKDQHVAVAIDGRGVRLGENQVPASTRGYKQLERWSRSLGAIHALGIEGTGSYGVGVARFMVSQGYSVIEVNSVGNQQKWDTLEAERSVVNTRLGQLPQSLVVSLPPLDSFCLNLLVS